MGQACRRGLPAQPGDEAAEEQLVLAGSLPVSLSTLPFSPSPRQQPLVSASTWPWMLGAELKQEDLGAMEAGSGVSAKLFS